MLASRRSCADMRSSAHACRNCLMSALLAKLQRVYAATPTRRRHQKASHRLTCRGPIRGPNLKESGRTGGIWHGSNKPNMPQRSSPARVGGLVGNTRGGSTPLSRMILEREGSRCSSGCSRPAGSPLWSPALHSVAGGRRHACSKASFLRRGMQRRTERPWRLVEYLRRLILSPDLF